LVAESFQAELIPADSAAGEIADAAESSETRATELSSESLSESSESLSETKKAG